MQLGSRDAPSRTGPKGASSSGAGPAAPARPRRRGGFAPFVRFLLVWIVTTWSVIGTLVAPVVPGGWLTVAAAILVTTAPLVIMLTARRRGRRPGARFRLLVLRPFWYVQLLLPLLAIAGLLGALAGAPFGTAGIAGRGAMAGMAVFAAAAGVAGWVGSRRLTVKHLVASHPGLPPGLEGLRIAQISDVHVGPHSSRRHLARVRRAVADAGADVIVVTGDLVDDHADDVADYAATLGALAAPLGVYAIPGNHDVYAGWPRVEAALARLPLAVLVNRAVTLERGGARLALVGTGDPAGRWAGSGAPDIPAALAGVPGDAFVVALAHNPALWPELAARGVPLTLSGHTHWGQLAVPSLGWSLASPFLEHAMGAYRRGDSLLYIHPGTNYWGIPFRIGALPEVAVITLHRGEAGISSERGMRNAEGPGE